MIKSQISFYYNDIKYDQSYHKILFFKFFIQTKLINGKRKFISFKEFNKLLNEILSL
jgi:hypothetical protein